MPRRDVGGESDRQQGIQPGGKKGSDFQTRAEPGTENLGPG